MRCWGELKSLTGQSVGEVSTCNFLDMWKWKSARPTTSRKDGYAPAKSDFWKLFFLFHTFVPRVFKGFQFFVRSHLIMPVSLNSKWLLDGHTLQGGHNGLSLVGHILKRCSTMMVAHQGLFFFLVPNFVFCLCTGILALRAWISWGLLIIFSPFKKDLCPNRSSCYSYKREKSSDILTLISLITMQSSATKW